MKNSIKALIALAVIGLLAWNANAADWGSFSTTRAASAAVATVVIPPQNGQIVNQAFCLTVASNATITVYRPVKATKVRTAVTATNTGVELYGTASNVVDGLTLDTSDTLLAYAASTGWQIVGLGVVEANYNSATNFTTYATDANITLTAGQTVYIANNADDLSFPAVAANDQTKLQNIFAGMENMPVGISVPTAAHTLVLGGTYFINK